MDHYSKVYNKELNRQIKEVSDIIKFVDLPTAKQAAQVIRYYALNNISIQKNKIAETPQIPSSVSACAAEIKVMEGLNSTVKKLLDGLKPQFDLYRFVQRTMKNNSLQLESIKTLGITIELLNEILDKTYDDSLNSDEQEEDIYALKEPEQLSNGQNENQYIFSKSEINEMCSMIDTVVYNPEDTVVEIEEKKSFYEQHPIICEILISVIGGIITAIILQAAASVKEAVTKNMNASVIESFENSNKEKIKLPPGTYIKIINDSIPRYYEIEYTDPNSGEHKCGYIAKQCVIPMDDLNTEKLTSSR